MLIPWMPRHCRSASAAFPEGIDRSVFEEFLELMDVDAGRVLQEHCDIARRYLRDFHTAQDTENSREMAAAVHPLKSSSEHIGAREVSRIAGRMEEMCMHAQPDHTLLRELASELERHQQQVEAFIFARFPL